MTVQISELMKNYWDSEYTLSDPNADLDRIQALAAEKIAALGGRRPGRPGLSRAVRIALTAAAMAVLLSVTAYAVYQSTLADRVLEDGDERYSVTYSAVGEAPTSAPAGAEQYALGTEGDQSQYSCLGKNREYEAQKAWHDAQAASDEPLDARDLLDYADPHRLNYGVAYGVLAEKLDAIAEQYGLRLWQSSAYYDTEAELLTALGLESFYPAAPDERHAYIAYDDGSFEISGACLALPDGQALGCNIIRAVRGTLSDFLVLGDDPAQAQFETYAAADGTETDLALWPAGALLFADTENCHVTFWFYDGTDTGLTMDGLRRAADSIDFAALDRVNAPAAAENVAADLQQNIQDDPSHYREVSGKAQQVYDELGDYSLDALLPEGWKYEGSSVGTVEDVVQHFEWLEGQKTPGEADYHDTITLNYAPAGSEGYATNAWVTLTYERYWAEPDRAVIRNGQAFQNRRVTSISFPVSYGGEADLIPCAVGGYDGYYILSHDYGGRLGSQGTYLTWYDTDKQLLFTLAMPAEPFSVRDVLALAEDFAAAIRDQQGPALTGTVSDEVTERDADTAALGRFSLAAPAGFAPAELIGEESAGSWLRATQLYTNGGSPAAGYQRILLSWERRDWYEDGMEQAFLAERSGMHDAQADPGYADQQIRCTDCTVGGFAGYVYQSVSAAGPVVCWLDTERQLWFTLQMDDTLADSDALLDADALLTLAQTVTESFTTIC